MEPWPIGMLLVPEELPDHRVLLRRRKDLRGRVVSELAEMAAQGPEREPVDGGNGEVGKGPPQPPDEVIPSLTCSSTVQGEQGHALGIRPRLQKAGETLSEQGRLAGARRARHEEDPVLMVEHRGLLCVGLQAHRFMVAARSDIENRPRDLQFADADSFDLHRTPGRDNHDP